ncbi:HAMP domain-containing protein [Acetobacter lambici]|uniref:Methyl-accepting chemotaxis protein n=1 Tax=Acetobacter lambici TaxID=1332824 RepID=A0ABT1F0H2_9PROT|nr:methyl-accepting chemotaxis protein [Acetobacter lambici]MCP1242533.1 methyl-accepting chemotaxis protein [Acetobacter lambici]MCP1258716.1 methyl-accepting chemotaxis protein [Acetobacter lambici]NHO57024.1 HAMP domain-containing protein [Acetobacter lambici]
MKFGLVQKIVLATTIFLFVSAICVVAEVTHLVRDEMQQALLGKLHAGMRAAVSLLQRDMPGIHVTWNADGTIQRITADTVPLPVNGHGMADDISRVTGGRTVLFVTDSNGTDFIRRMMNGSERDQRSLDTPLDHNASSYKAIVKGDSYEGPMVLLGSNFYTVYQPIFSPEGKVKGVLNVAIRGDEADAVISGFLWTLTLVSAGVMLVATVGMGVVTAWLLRPLPVITQSMRVLAEGDTATPVSYIERRDEIGTMAGAVEVFRQAAIDKARLESEAADARRRQESERRVAQERTEEAARQLKVATDSLADGLQKMAGGDLSVQIRTRFAPDLEPLRENFNQSIEQLAGAFMGVSGSAHSIGNSTQELATAADNLSRRTEQQAATLEETSVALTQITQRVQKTTEETQHAHKVVNTSRKDVDHAGVVVGQAIDAMSRIDESSKAISTIIGLINDVAFQTNILALNASVEAARAGDSGRGFAVVASEVRQLAHRSAEAVKEISSLINGSTEQVKAGVLSVKETGTVLHRIVGQVGEISELVSNIATAAQDQATSIMQLNVAITSMEQTTQQNAAVAEQSAAASHNLAIMSGELQKLVGRFELGNMMRLDKKAGQLSSRPVSLQLVAE